MTFERCMFPIALAVLLMLAASAIGSIRSDELRGILAGVYLPLVAFAAAMKISDWLLAVEDDKEDDGGDL